MSKKLFDLNPEEKEKAFLVIVGIKSAFEQRDPSDFTFEEDRRELKTLVVSSRCSVVGSMEVNLSKVRPSLFIGKGKAEEIAAKAKEKGAGVVIFNVNLSSAQQGNLEDIIGIKTIDRTQLILDIFARHARSNAGKIQVELAQLEYLLPRLRGKGLILSRLGGGIGTRGPGEKKLEIERRRIEERIGRLKKELEKVRSHRDRLRSKRKKRGVFVVALVGYTSAGKTTLLNALTESRQKTEQALFTTLDPLSRMLKLKEKVIVSDTVGFIHDLPKKLTEAFKATLEELEYADMLVHVVDVSKPNFQKRIQAVRKVLADLNLIDKRCLKVFNKIDKLTKQDVQALQGKYPYSLFISAIKGKGVKEFCRKIEENIFQSLLTVDVFIPYAETEAMNFLYKKAQILKTSDSSLSGINFRVRIKDVDLKKLKPLIS